MLFRSGKRRLHQNLSRLARFVFFLIRDEFDFLLREFAVGRLLARAARDPERQFAFVRTFAVVMNQGTDTICAAAFALEAAFDGFAGRTHGASLFVLFDLLPFAFVVRPFEADGAQLDFTR